MAAVGLEVTTDGIGTGTGTERDGGREFQILGAVNIPEQVPGRIELWLRLGSRLGLPFRFGLALTWLSAG